MINPSAFGWIDKFFLALIMAVMGFVGTKLGAL